MEHLSDGCQCEGKLCTKCKVVRCVRAYTKDARLRSGLKSRCQICSNADNKRWREENKEYNSVRTRTWSKENPELVSQAKKRRYIKNKEVINAKARLRRRENKIIRGEKPPKDIVAHFLSKVQKDEDDGCWLWIGGRKPNGYGVFIVDRRNVYAHRWSYEHYKGEIPDGLVLDHLCKVKHCVNPAHLEVVTQAENIKRAFAHITHCSQGHPYDEANTIWSTNGDRSMKRICRECNRQKHKTRYVASGRTIRTHCSKGHLLTEENTYQYGDKRSCKICQNTNSSRNQKKRRQGIPVPRRHEMTHCLNGHPYTEENTGFIRGYRHCKACRRESTRKRRAVSSVKVQKKHYSDQEWADLKAYYNYTCLCCGRKEPEIKLTADHVIPKALGGIDLIDNIQPLCMPCNLKKRAKAIDFRPQKP